jgi:hypothetical protein
VVLVLVLVVMVVVLLLLQRDDATDAHQRLEIEVEFLRTEAEKSRNEINSLHSKSMENIRVLKVRMVY